MFSYDFMENFAYIRLTSEVKFGDDLLHFYSTFADLRKKLWSKNISNFVL